jgi:hypothetical protein
MRGDGEGGRRQEAGGRKFDIYLCYFTVSMIDSSCLLPPASCLLLPHPSYFTKKLA